MDNFEQFRDKISNNIKYFRNINNITQNYISDEICISQSTVSDYENGKKMDLHILFDISKVLNVPINELLFSDNFQDNSNITFPISKLMNKTYFCYYSEHAYVKCFQLKVFNNKNRYKADVKIKFDDKKEWLNGEITLNDKFAVAIINIPNKNKHHILTFNYFHDSDNDKYVGGVALYQTVNYESICPQVQFCVISEKELESEIISKLKYNFLNLENGYDKSSLLCGPTIKEDLDKKFYFWLNGKYNF